jgi:hypothetical protein
MSDCEHGFVNPLDNCPECMHERIATLEAERDELRKVVEKLPVNADGDSVVPGSEQWDKGGVTRVIVESIYTDCDTVLVGQPDIGDEQWELYVDNLYSSEAAAREAGESQ